VSEITAALQETYVSGFSTGRQFERRAAQGTTWFEISVSRKSIGEGVDARFIVILRNITERKSAAREIEHLAFYDGLTGLPNRPLLLHRLKAAIDNNQRGGRHGALLFLDLDHFKTLNDAHGHTVGNHLLKQIANRMQQTLGEKTVAARFADHIFAVLCLDHNHKQTQEQADKIRAAFDGHILEVGTQSVNLSVSMGGVQIGEKIASVPQVLAKSNQCLQSAEGVGGNRIEIFDPAARDRAEEERIAAWLQRIKEALSGDQFVLNFQPLISLAGDEKENYEVLVRMTAPTGETVSPEVFLPIAEENGLLADIDRWVIGRTISLLAERKKAGKSTTLYVKVTPASLVEGDLHNFIISQLKAHGVAGENLETIVAHAEYWLRSGHSPGVVCSFSARRHIARYRARPTSEIGNV